MTLFPFSGLGLWSPFFVQLAITPTWHFNSLILITILKLSSWSSIDLSEALSEQLNKWLYGFSESNKLHSILQICALFVDSSRNAEDEEEYQSGSDTEKIN